MEIWKGKSKKKKLRLMENYLKESEMSKSTKTSKSCVGLRYLQLEAREQEVKGKRAQREACVFAKKQRRLRLFSVKTRSFLCVRESGFRGSEISG